MFGIVEGFVYIVRFGLEMVTIFTLIVGGLLKGTGAQKIGFPILGVLVILFWGLFVAPKALYPQGPLLKLIVEVAVFAVGTIGMYQLYNANAAKVYAIVAIIDLAFVYLLSFISR